MKDFVYGTVRVKPCRNSEWRIEHFEVDEERADAHNLRVLCNSANPVEFIRPGTYTKLINMEREAFVMSNTPMEIETCRKAYENATGYVLVNGLGLGMVLDAMLSKPDVLSIRVIETSESLIELVGPYYKDNPRIEIIHDDAFEYEPQPGAYFNYVWHDIWDDICEDNVEQMVQLEDKYEDIADDQDFWSADMIAHTLNHPWGGREYEIALRLGKKITINQITDTEAEVTIHGNT